ncbi:DUF480 domain-containing protein [Aestuariibacter halophilus]|uniref:DUF480 domain-containing protein n=1 Tax=Fluctibacter halophilus TaxID=226011 RepID=A0ABS8GC08_9ALTE|nr:DUF480 domain-containing protein [Aestuariibacter halophilus]MCC2618107.1 DUF480 domain-containing protein [Aestuariibacter halophilus]
MLVTLTPIEQRIIGVMLEKQTTTPDQYPLSLNGLTTGCNQKSNREPVMSLSEGEVQDALDSLRDKKQIREETGFGSRVVKYQQRFCNTEFGDLKLTEQQRAIVCLLLLRGPQTPGELRTRCQRMAEFTSVAEVEKALDGLQHMPDPVVVCLAREPGKRESRYAHCFADTAAQVAAPQAAMPSANDESSDQQRIDALEQQVARLQRQLAQVCEQLGITPDPE